MGSICFVFTWCLPVRLLMPSFSLLARSFVRSLACVLCSFRFRFCVRLSPCSHFFACVCVESAYALCGWSPATHFQRCHQWQFVQPFSVDYGPFAYTTIQLRMLCILRIKWKFQPHETRMKCTRWPIACNLYRFDRSLHLREKNVHYMCMCVAATLRETNAFFLSVFHWKYVIWERKKSMNFFFAYENKSRAAYKRTWIALFLFCLKLLKW